ncbi:hypothetical protein CR513_53566, partial [Mucuna pruriens]
MSTFRQLQIPQFGIRPHHEQLVGFSGERVDTQEYFNLLTTFKDDKTTRMIFVQYLVVAVETSYNILISRPTLNTLGAIISTPHLVMKFPSSDQQSSWTHVHSSSKAPKPSKSCNMYSSLTTNTRAAILGTDARVTSRPIDIHLKKVHRPVCMAVVRLAKN